MACPLSASLASFIASTAPSVTAVQSYRSRSSGFVWRPGLIVTADEALSEDGEFAVTLSGGETVPAQLVGRDPSTDIALLRVDRSDLRPAPLEVAPVLVGALAIAIGCEEGAPIAALGIVSRSEGAWCSLRGGEIDARIELDLRLRRSAEGGLVLSPKFPQVSLPRAAWLAESAAWLACDCQVRLQSPPDGYRGRRALGSRAFHAGRLTL